MKPHKAEVDAVIAVLQEGHEDAEAGAKAVIAALDKARTDRVLYGVAVQGTPCAFVYHGFGNKQEALTWINKYGLAGVDGLSVGVIPLLSPERPAKRLAEALAEMEAQRESKIEPPKRGRGRRPKG